MKVKAIVSVLMLSALMLCSCGGSASKARPAIEKAVRNYRAASKSDAARYLKMKNRMEQARNIYNEYFTSDLCRTCGGTGVVYQINEYGYVVTDYYGNTIFYFCPICGGSGQY